MDSRRRRVKWLGLAGVLVALLVGVAAQLGTGAGSVAGQASAAETILGTGGRASPPPAIRRVGTATATSVSDDAAVAGVLADLGIFWAERLPKDFGRPLPPLTGGYVSIDATAPTGSTWCVGKPEQIAGNAYYCPDGDAIVYDSAGLVPVLLGHYGVAGLTAAFAHEFGHAIQARIGPTEAQRTAHPARYPSILIEAQGDCFAGAFLAWVVAGRSPHVQLPSSSMVRAVAPLLDFRDPPDVSVDDASAHGLGLDRLTSILRGYHGGAKACAVLTAAALKSTLGRPGISAAPVPRYGRPAEVTAAARKSVGAFAGALPGRRALDLTTVVPAATDHAAAGPFGQFAEAAALALAAGRAITSTPAGAACFTGAWTASVFGHAAPGALGSWAGDADEALDMLRARPAATFDELTGYADGFAGGWPACADR